MGSSGKTYIGGCHCGRVEFKVKADLVNDRNGICNYTSCTMKGFVHHHVKKADFSLTRGNDDLKLYKFGTLSAEHYFCSHCGVESFYRSRSDPNEWDVNVRCLRDADTGQQVDIYSLEYWLSDGAHWEESQTKRNEREEEAKKTGNPYRPTVLWRLMARTSDVPADLDVASEFRKSWDDSL
jgi:hypothetical protein